MSMGLCSVCSELELTNSRRHEFLGTFNELILKSRGSGDGRSGCGGCAFFCTVIQNSDRWRSRHSELPDHTVVLDSEKVLHILGFDLHTGHDTMFDTCTAEGRSGKLFRSLQIL